MLIHQSSMGRILLFEISINFDLYQFVLVIVQWLASRVVTTALFECHI